ncbi:hypothetical protein H2200_006236 [Cladophialophora chaetospira]|uniref:Uncharacterized protein n=1 Tax=Cladophialophora chaetospira TaxID=386627 RepID=A0AA38XAI8_9EURO|nr:hypothetical protein H2200_006236 [Cladophialophora chaetospira]
MRSSSWINLSHHWRLQDVQAALNVVIATLCISGIYACARFCWQASVARRLREQNIPISTLFSVNTIGEAVDVLLLLRSKVFQRRHAKILLQACLVILLSVTAFASGPIARYSTKLAPSVVSKQIPGFIARRGQNSILNSPLSWNETSTSLDHADFPHDQLLDYLPDATVDWTYVPREWNSTWTMDCKDTNRTKIALGDVGGNCTSLLYELPGLKNVISLEKYSVDNISSYWGAQYSGGRNVDVLIGLAAAKMTDIDEATGVTLGMQLDLAAVHMHNLSMQEDSDSICSFGNGTVERASYTKIECTITRRSKDPDLVYVAFPDSHTPSLVSWALVEQYQGRLLQQSIRTGNITLPNPTDLKRFYQVWVATKDTLTGLSVPRQISVQVSVVQLSSTFLALSLLASVLIFLSVAVYFINNFRNRSAFQDVPESKLEWMLRVVDATDRPTLPRHSTNSNSLYSLPSLNTSRTSRLGLIATSVQENADRRRMDFENARYRDAPSTVDLSSTDAFPPPERAAVAPHAGSARRHMPGNTTNSFIGTTSFTTSISANNVPLTWTVGASSPNQDSSSNSTDATFQKNFYLGTPPELNLASSINFAGCALFFEGIARSLPLNGTAEYGSVSCSQALQDNCVNDLLSQATKQMKALGRSGNGDSQSVCDALQSTLETNPPQSCTIATVTWGSIIAKALTGSQSPSSSHISQTTCHPASNVNGGSDYNIALIETQTVTSEDVSSDIAPFFYSLTPILTVFYSASGSTSSLPEAQLSCLKVVEDSNLVQPESSDASLLGLHKALMALALALSVFAAL